jgi:predicted PhzF superfamily epimerase YddE/YHI9
MVLPIFQVNAFTDKLFSGNPAGVCILSEPKNDKWLQNVTKELIVIVIHLLSCLLYYSVVQ